MARNRLTLKQRLIPTLTLRLALVCYVILPLILAIAGLGTLLLKTFEERIEERMKEDVQLIARTLEIPIQRALEQEREGSVRSALEAAVGINRVYGVYVYGPDGETMASAGAVNLEPDRRRLSTLAGEDLPQGEYEEISGRNVYSYFVPLTGPGQRATGLLHITRRERDIRASVAGLRGQVAGLSAIAVLFVAGMVLIGHRGAIGRHLSSLQNSMQRVEEGDVDHRSHVQGPREISDLAHALNRMLDSLERAEREIEQRREAETDLQEQLRHAEKLAALGTLSAGVAHELGTPLSVIEGRAYRILRAGNIPPDAEHAFGIIRSQVHRMERIIRQLLDFGRKSSQTRTSVRPGFLVDAAAQSVQDEAEVRGVAVEVRSADPPDVVHVDPVRIEQVLTNLIRNGIDAAEHGRVRVTYDKADDDLLLLVEDDGPGIDADLSQHIFEPFFTTKRVGDGTGLGLAVVHGIIKEHYGSIDVGRSELGGALFTIRIPIMPPDDDRVEGRRRTSAPIST